MQNRGKERAFRNVLPVIGEATNMIQGYVVDASVAVQWFTAYNEQSLKQAYEVLRGALEKNYELMAPDILLHEVSNALVRGKKLRGKSLERSLDVFFSLPLTYFRATNELIASASLLAAEYSLPVYDALYCALALERHAPLITGTIRHQGRVRGLAVIDINDWQNHSTK